MASRPLWLCSLLWATGRKGRAPARNPWTGPCPARSNPASSAGRDAAAPAGAPAAGPGAQVLGECRPAHSSAWAPARVQGGGGVGYGWRAQALSWGDALGFRMPQLGAPSPSRDLLWEAGVKPSPGTPSSFKKGCNQKLSDQGALSSPPGCRAQHWQLPPTALLQKVLGAP